MSEETKPKEVILGTYNVEDWVEDKLATYFENYQTEIGYWAISLYTRIERLVDAFVEQGENPSAMDSKIIERVFPAHEEFLGLNTYAVVNHFFNLGPAQLAEACADLAIPMALAAARNSAKYGIEMRSEWFTFWFIEHAMECIVYPGKTVDGEHIPRVASVRQKDGWIFGLDEYILENSLKKGKKA